MIQNIKKIQSPQILASSILFLFFAVPLFAFAAITDPLVLCGREGTPDCDFQALIRGINGIIQFLAFNVAAPLAAIAFTYAGWLYITAGSNPSKREEAHKIFTNVIIGLVFVFGAWLIVTAILSGLGVGSEFKTMIAG